MKFTIMTSVLILAIQTATAQTSVAQNSIQNDSVKANQAVQTAPSISKKLFSMLSPVFGYKHLAQATTQGSLSIRGLVDQVVDSYNSRFDSEGILLSGDPRSGAFVTTQESVFSDLEKRAAIKNQFTISNNMVSDMNAQISLIVDESGVPLAFAVKYKKMDEVMRVQLRIRPLNSLLTNSTLQEINGVPSVALNSQTSDFSKGGDVQIVVLVDLKKKVYMTFPIRIAKDTSSQWGIFYAQIRALKVDLKLWFNLFGGNGGIKQVTVNSQQSVTLNAF